MPFKKHTVNLNQIFNVGALKVEISMLRVKIRIQPLRPNLCTRPDRICLLFQDLVMASKCSNLVTIIETTNENQCAEKLVKVLQMNL